MQQSLSKKLIYWLKKCFIKVIFHVDILQKQLMRKLFWEIIKSQKI